MEKRQKEISALRWLICGGLIGAGAILPGVSGGVLAVIFDIYRPFMEILTSPRKALPVSLSVTVQAGWFGHQRLRCTAS